MFDKIYSSDFVKTKWRDEEVAASVYLAGPFFDDEQRKILQAVETNLRHNESVQSVFVPMKETNQAGLEPGTAAWRKLVYQEDLAGLTQADVLVAIYDYGADASDPGTMFEIGYAAAHHMPIVVYNQQQPILNLMIAESLTYYCTAVKQLRQLDFSQLPHKGYPGKVM